MTITETRCHPRFIKPRLKANLFRLDERWKLEMGDGKGTIFNSMDLRTLTDELRGSIPLQATMKQLHKTAAISKCEKYRYKLTRTWDEDKGKVLFIMLNPSTANHIENDLTTIRCINFAEKWGYGGIMIGNIYPFRAKRPKNLRKWLKEHNGVGIANWENQCYIQDMAGEADIVVCAWGCNYKGGIPEWVEELGSLHYLELCDDGITPKHPLGNLSKDLVPIKYKLNTIIDG